MAKTVSLTPFDEAGEVLEAADESRTHPPCQCQVMSLPTTESGSQCAGSTSRRRASRACLSCRARKVRCDYVVVGRPCTNCKLDHYDCVVQSSRRRRQSNLVAAALEQQEFEQDTNWFPGTPEQCSEPPPKITEPEPENTALAHLLRPLRAACVEPTPHLEEESSPLELEASASEDDPVDATLVMQDRHFVDLAKFLDEGVTNASRKKNLLPWSDQGLGGQRRSSPWDQPSCQRSWPHSLFSPALFCEARSENRPPSSPVFAVADGGLPTTNGNFVIFSCYHFVASNSLWMLSQRDVKVLEQKGCLHLPQSAALNELIDKFFLYVHPTLPIIDEASFRRLHEGRISVSFCPEPLSLSVLQALIFAACPFVSSSTLRSLGFSSVREARTKFYDVCATLLRIDNSKDNISVAQCALLLTYYAPRINDRTNTHWLKTAIKAAREGRAHLYDSSDNVDGRKSTLKRLWWCCILRDRIMSLGLRRALEIKPGDFEFTLPGLAEDDFRDEIENSSVYNPATKRALVQLLSLLCDFAVVVNDILTLCYDPLPKKSDHQRQLHVLKQHVYGLDGWYDSAVARIRAFNQMPDLHESSSIFTNAIYIYYFTAKACIYDQLMLELSSQAPEPVVASPYETWYAVNEVDEAVCNITESFRQLEKQDSTRYLPNTFVAFSTLPFLWHMEKSKNQHGPPGDGRDEVQKDLAVYRELFRSFSGIYDVTDSVLERLREVTEVTSDKATDLLEKEILRHPLM